MDIRTCDELPCKTKNKLVNTGDWETWSTWNQCSASCGPGTQIRNRKCKKVKIIFFVLIKI